MREGTVKIIATFFGIGYAPVASGTAASLAAWLVFIFLLPQNAIVHLAAIAVTLILGYMVSTEAERVFGKKDPGEVVIDEVAGMLIALFCIPIHPASLILAFVCFRIFDIVKVPPAGAIEKLRGAAGIMGDDVLCGIYANIVCQVVFRLIFASG